jgi:hypothetical protein
MLAEVMAVEQMLRDSLGLRVERSRELGHAFHNDPQQ